MCGIAGIVSKNQMDISEKLLAMLQFIQHRGPDAAGIAFFEKSERVTLRVTLETEDAVDKMKEIITDFGTVLEESSVRNVAGKVCYELIIDMDPSQVRKLHETLNTQKEIAVHSIGNEIRVYKEGGSIWNLTDRYQIKCQNSRHGIAHVRMATESAEDVNAAHPFVSPFYPELAIVHNGQFTNYFNMRRFLESKGASFKTMNDSEAASHMIAYAMSMNGGDLEQALLYAKEKMDGIFCIIAATPDQIGFVKDNLGIKPLLVAQTEDYVMFGSEQIEFYALAENLYAQEMEPGEVKVWNI